MDHATDAIHYLTGMPAAAAPLEARAHFTRVNTRWVERRDVYTVQRGDQPDIHALIARQERQRLEDPALRPLALRSIDWRPLIKEFHRLAEQIAPTYGARAFLLAGRLELRLAGDGLTGESSIGPRCLEWSEPERSRFLASAIHHMLPLPEAETNKRVRMEKKLLQAQEEHEAKEKAARREADQKAKGQAFDRQLALRREEQERMYAEIEAERAQLEAMYSTGNPIVFYATDGEPVVIDDDGTVRQAAADCGNPDCGNLELYDIVVRFNSRLDKLKDNFYARDDADALEKAHERMHDDPRRLGGVKSISISCRSKPQFSQTIAY